MARKKSQKKASGKPRSFLGALLWTICFLALLLALDQLALHLKPATPLLQELQSGYRTFRSRLLGHRPQPPLTIEAVIDRNSNRPSPKTTVQPSPKPLKRKVETPPRKTAVKQPTATPAAGKYLYVDADGELQFADRLEDIPPALRKEAQPLRD